MLNRWHLDLFLFFAFLVNKHSGCAHSPENRDYSDQNIHDFYHNISSSSIEFYLGKQNDPKNYHTFDDSHSAHISNLTSYVLHLYNAFHHIQ